LLGTILLVDDDIMNRKLLTVLLGDEEYVFHHAADGVHALQIISDEQVDLIILEIEMQGMNGFQFLEEFNQRHPEPRTPIIVSSKVKDLPSIKRALKLGAADYFLKQLDDEAIRIQLPLKVKNLVKLKQLQLEAIEKLKMKAVMELAGAANHEINQPLMVLLGNLQLMAMRTSEDDPLLEQLQLLERNTKRIAAIVKKIGGITRLTTKPYLDNDMIIDLQAATGSSRTDTDRRYLNRADYGGKN
jgi:CheY-like chemotaxis protein